MKTIISAVIKEAKWIGKTAKKEPKFWDSQFTTNVIDAYKKGKLTKHNIKEWETEYNGGVTPHPSLGTADILDYYITTKKEPRTAN